MDKESTHVYLYNIPIIPKMYVSLDTCNFVIFDENN